MRITKAQKFSEVQAMTRSGHWWVLVMASLKWAHCFYGWINGHLTASWTVESGGELAYVYLMSKMILVTMRFQILRLTLFQSHWMVSLAEVAHCVFSCLLISWITMPITSEPRLSALDKHLFYLCTSIRLVMECNHFHNMWPGVIWRANWHSKVVLNTFTLGYQLTVSTI